MHACVTLPRNSKTAPLLRRCLSLSPLNNKNSHQQQQHRPAAVAAPPTASSAQRSAGCTSNPDRSTRPKHTLPLWSRTRACPNRPTRSTPPLWRPCGDWVTASEVLHVLVEEDDMNYAVRFHHSLSCLVWRMLLTRDAAVRFRTLVRT